MKQKILLLCFVLASAIGASAQSVLFKNLMVKPGGKSFIEFTITDVASWNDYSGMQFGIPVPEGVKPGSKKDIDFGGLLLEGDRETTIENTDIKLVRDNPDFDFEGTYIYFSLTGGYYNLSYEGEDDVTIKLPIIVSEEAEEVTEFEMDLDAVKQSFLILTEGFQYDFVDEQEYENGLITISSGFRGTIFDPRSVSEDKKFETEDELKAVLSKTENTIVEFAVEVPREWAKLPNVVVKGRAKEIILSNKEAYTYKNEEEKGFMTQKVSFTYNFSAKAKSYTDCGWNSLVIPFDGKPEIEPFTKATSESGKFWAMQFYGSDEKGLIFNDMEDVVFMSNQLYILAFPGESFGEKEFEGNSLLITGEDVWVAHSVPDYKLGGDPYYSMIINYGGKTTSPNAFVLDPEKNKYVYSESPVDVPPFSTFAVKDIGSGDEEGLSTPILEKYQFTITSVEPAPVATGIVVYTQGADIVIKAATGGEVSVYSLGGQLVRNGVKYHEGETRIKGLNPGAYIVAGKIVVIK
ncbi:MAG: T9SS type A sorting domain-containing protein [Bacteroidales bacterium]|nr:T9SS type A sorting domain-containing protein [Bacteroidales bacterium]